MGQESQKEDKWVRSCSGNNEDWGLRKKVAYCISFEKSSYQGQAIEQDEIWYNVSFENVTLVKKQSSIIGYVAHRLLNAKWGSLVLSWLWGGDLEKIQDWKNTVSICNFLQNAMHSPFAFNQKKCKTMQFN